MKGLKLIASLLSILFIYGVYYFFMPAMSLLMPGGFLFIGFALLVVVVNICMWMTNEDSYDFGPWYILIVIFAIIVVVFFVIAIGSSALFHSQAKYSQIGKIDEKSFTEDIVEIDNSQIPIVDISLAEKLADKKIGEKMALGSQVQLGNFDNKQQINGKLYYVIPLEFSGFFKWNQNKTDGTPGYLMVSATNLSDVKFIQEVNGEQLHLRYMEYSFFSQNLKRHLRNSGLRTEGLTEYTFELDDDLNPHWVVTIYENKIGFGTPEAVGVAICDPQSGKVEKYSLEEVPEWVDIVQPESFVKEQIVNYGRYPHGFWNFSNKDERSMTEHMTTVFYDGDCYYYTGMSSVGKDASTIGFIMVNSRTKASKFYKMTGATEEAAMGSAEGKVQNMHYTSTVPIPLNVSGVPTFFMTLKDDAGLVKQYAMVNIEDYSIVAAADTIAEVKRQYISAVNSAGGGMDFGDDTYSYTKEGKVARIGSNIESGNTIYYITLDGINDMLFSASYSLSDELPITQIGDKVTVTYLDDKNGTINIVAFDNLEYTQKKSEKQEEIEASEQEVRDEKQDNITEVDPEAQQKEWDSLTDEEKAKLLQQQENADN